MVGDLAFGDWNSDRDWGLQFGIGIGDMGIIMRLEIGHWALGFGIWDWDWALGLEIGMGDGIGTWDWD